MIWKEFLILTLSTSVVFALEGVELDHEENSRLSGVERRLRNDARMVACLISSGYCSSKLLRRLTMHQWTDGKCTERCVTRFGSLIYQRSGWICGTCVVTATIGPLGGNVSIPGVGSLVASAGTFETDTDISMVQTTDPGVQVTFNETATMFRPSGRLSYEVKIVSDQAPLLDTVNMTLNVPVDLQIPQGYTVEVFALSETASPYDGPFSIFILIDESRFDSIAQVVEFELPSNSFIDDGNGNYVAVVTLSPTPGGNSRRFRSIRNLQAKCEASSLRCPLPGGCVVTSSFSKERKHPVTGVVRPHWGVDYSAATGTPVTAAASGTVEESRVMNGYGNTVVIRHESGSATLYAHLDSRSVQVGDTINQGDQLGEAGNTGIGTGPHLHFEYVPNGQIIQSKNRIDPHPCVDEVTSGSITVGDNGSAADDAFKVSLDGFVLGTTTIGATNNLSANNVIPGSHSLTLEVVIAPDDVGTYFVELSDGWTFDDGGTIKSDAPPQGTIITWGIIVPKKQ